MNYNVTVTEYIENSPTAHKRNLDLIRKLIHESVEDVSEAVKWGFPVFKKSKDFAYLRAAKNHITLGFYNFDRIHDPDGLLQGEGNTLRHIKIKAQDDINQTLVAEWLMAVAN